jgi:hypothetical protein
MNLPSPPALTVTRHRCPHCGIDGLRNLAVRWSYREAPAKCEHCGKLSHVLASVSNGIAGLDLVLSALFVVAAVALGSWLFALAGFCLVVAHNIWAWRQVELFPISEDSAKMAARVSWWVMGLAVILRVFSS